MRIFDRSRVEAVCGPTRPYHIVSEILPWVFFLITAVLLAAFWGRIPDQVPLKTDLHGHVTNMGDRSDILKLGGLYFFINICLWITGFYPESWNAGVRFGGIGKRRGVKNYPLTRDLLCDMRISMSLLFSGALLWTAFDNGRCVFALIALVALCVLVPMVRYWIRMALCR